MSKQEMPCLKTGQRLHEVVTLHKLSMIGSSVYYLHGWERWLTITLILRVRKAQLLGIIINSSEIGEGGPDSDQSWGNLGLAPLTSRKEDLIEVSLNSKSYIQLNNGKMLDKNRTPSGDLCLLFICMYCIVQYSAEFRVTFLPIFSINGCYKMFVYSLYNQIFSPSIQCLTPSPLLRHANCLNANPTPPASSSLPSNLLFAARGNPRHHLVTHRPIIVPELATAAMLEETGLQNWTVICPWEPPPRNTHGENPTHPRTPEIPPTSNTTIHAEDADVRTQ